MKKFTNYTNKDFSVSWDGKEYTFLPGESGIFEDGIATTFAKHLADTIFGGTVVSKDTLFINEMNKAISEVGEIQPEEVAEQVLVEVEKEPEEEIEIVIKEEKPKKKGRKSKKEEFEGLDEIDETNI